MFVIVPYSYQGFPHQEGVKFKPNDVYVAKKRAGPFVRCKRAVVWIVVIEGFLGSFPGVA